MNPIFEFLFEQYKAYEPYEIVLEGIAFVFTLLSMFICVTINEASLSDNIIR